MGSSSSKLEDDKALALCRERKKFVRQALDGRCSLAAAHVAYIQSLKNTGTALRKFVEPEAPVESSLYTSTNATPEPLALTEKSLSHFSFSSPLSHRVDAVENLSPSPSPPSSSHFHANHMKFRGFSSRKVEEKPPVAITATVTTSSTPQNMTPRSIGNPETSPFEDSPARAGTPPWDYFGLFHPIDNEFSSQDAKEMNHGLEIADDLKRLREEEGIPDLEDEEKTSFDGSEKSVDSEDEFDDPPTDTLVRRFENLNRVHDNVEVHVSPTVISATSAASEAELLNGEKKSTASLSPLRSPSPSPADAIPTDTKKTPMKEDQMKNKVSAKDFVSSMKDIEYLFIKASESGKEVPRMLEANKLHFRPIALGKENGSMMSTVLKACFSCGEDPSQVQEEPAQNSVKYLTWHRTTSSRSSSSRTPLGVNGKDDGEDLAGDLFENFCMNSGSHASTLDRLYAWERKLHDEVKASQRIRKIYDSKCDDLRQLESKQSTSLQIDKTRAAVKDLHSRIRVAIHRIDCISKRIEELRDTELQPQLEELIEGLSRMWEVMLECHRLQCNIITMAYVNGNAKISIQSESHRQITLHLEHELGSLSSSFTKWIGAQKSYLEAINNWLFKCVFLPHKPTKRKRKQQAPWETLRNCGPPIYATCGVWLDRLKELPVKEVAESIKVLAAETSTFLPRLEKHQGKHAKLASWKNDGSNDLTVNMLREESSEDSNSGLQGFRSRMEDFLRQLNDFAASSAHMYADLQKAIQDAKNKYEQLMSQPQVA